MLTTEVNVGAAAAAAAGAGAGAGITVLAAERLDLAAAGLAAAVLAWGGLALTRPCLVAAPAGPATTGTMATASASVTRCVRFRTVRSGEFTLCVIGSGGRVPDPDPRRPRFRSAVGRNPAEA